jgi:Phage MuF-C-terminal domain
LRDDDLLAGWAAVVDKIIRGEELNRPTVTVGPTPDLLRGFGLSASSLSMTVAKVARCRRKHPEVPLAVWHDLPNLLADPLAIFPSQMRDGSVVIVLVVQDRTGAPVLVAATAGDGSVNMILSVYGKDSGLPWVANEIAAARAAGLLVYEKNGFAVSLPQPPVAEATSSSHDLISSNGTTKPKRHILSLRK